MFQLEYANRVSARGDMVLKVYYYYSACIGIRSLRTSILCDPWFTDGAYDGSWYQYPKLENPLKAIGRYDYIYVSHIHPDHFDPDFLKLYLKEYPEAKVIVANFKNNFLSKKMAGNAIRHSIIDELELEDVSIRIFPNETSHIYDIDSALAVLEKSTGHSVVNMNDNAFNAALVNDIKLFTKGGPTIALLGFTGAGPYPQTYMEIGPALLEAAEKKKKDFFGRYLKMKNELNPKVTIPYAGKYVLGGKLARLNPYRGVADAVEVAAFDETAVVLDDGGDAFIDTVTLTPNRARKDVHDPEKMEKYLMSLENREMEYERFFRDLPPKTIPFRMLLPKCAENALRKSESKEDFYFCIKIGEGFFVCNANKEKREMKFEAAVESFSPRSEVTIDPRYLYGLITGVFHWNNADVGSQFSVRRIPDVFNRDAQNFLSFFHL